METAIVQKKRNTTIDSIKFVMIAFVVMGHTLTLDLWGGQNIKFFYFIYTFHMPVFIMISGYFYRDLETWKFWRTILELLLVILIFQIIYFSKGWRDPFDFSLEGIWYRVSHFYSPIRALWYILSLCFWRLIMRFYPKKIRENYKITIPIALAVSLLIGFVPSLNVVQRTLVFFPYFLIGFYINKYNCFWKIRGWNRWMCGTIIILYLVILLLIPHFPSSIVMASKTLDYLHGKDIPLIYFALRAFSYLWVLPLSFCVINVIPDCNWLASQGKNTIFYYLYHPYFVWIANWCVTNFNAPISTIFLIIYTIISLYFMYWLSKISFLKFLTKPITTIVCRR